MMRKADVVSESIIPDDQISFLKGKLGFLAVFSIFGLWVGLISSQSLMDLFIILTSFLSLLLLLKTKKGRLLNQISKPIYVSILWVLILLLGFYAQAEKGASVQVLLGDFVWILHLPLWFYLWHFLRVDVRWAYSALWILLIGSLFAVMVYFIGFDPLHQTWSDRAQNLSVFWRSGGLFSNAMALAQSYGPLAMILLPLSLFYLYRGIQAFSFWDSRKEKPKKKQEASKLLRQFFPSRLSWLLPLTFFLTSLAVVFTFTRGVWLAMTLSSLLGGFMLSRRWGFTFLFGFFIAGFVLMMAWPKFQERAFQVFNTEKSYDSERVVLWKTNWFIFKESPWLGIGYGENKRRLREFYDRLHVPEGQFEGHAHNQFLHFLAGTGLLGLLFYLGWCFYFLKINYQIYKRLEIESGVSRDASIANPTADATSTLTPVSVNKELSLFFLGLFLAQISFHIGSLTESNFIIAKNRMLLVGLWSFILYFYHSHSSKSSLSTT